MPIIPPELSACPAWASPSGFQASSMLPQGQRAPLEALRRRTHPCARRVPGGPGHSGPLLQADLAAGLGGLGAPSPFLLQTGQSLLSQPIGLQAPHSRWPRLAGKQAGGVGQGGGQQAAGGCCVTVSWAACPAVTQPSPTAGTARWGTVRAGPPPSSAPIPGSLDVTAPHGRHLTLNGAREAWPRRKSPECGPEGTSLRADGGKPPNVSA